MRHQVGQESPAMVATYSETARYFVERADGASCFNGCVVGEVKRCNVKYEDKYFDT